MADIKQRKQKPSKSAGVKGKGGEKSSVSRAVPRSASGSQLDAQLLYTPRIASEALLSAGSR